MIPATRVPGRATPTDGKGRRLETCPRCGLGRQVNRGSADKLCGSCRDVTETLGERRRWT